MPVSYKEGDSRNDKGGLSRYPTVLCGRYQCLQPNVSSTFEHVMGLHSHFLDTWYSCVTCFGPKS